MKVIAINSSRRNKNTYSLIMQVKKILEKYQIQMEIINLHDFKLNYCLGCENCIINNHCPINDDYQKIIDKIIKADGVIFSSPVYLKNVSGILKVLFDRSCSLYHRPIFYKKPSLVIATTKGSGLKNTLAYLKSISTQLGFIYCGKIGRSIFTMKNNIKEKEVKKFINYLKSDSSIHQPSLNEIINLNIQKVLSKCSIKLDHQYWNDKNWYHMDYYYPCKISFLKKLIGKIIYSLLSMIIIKNKFNN